MSLDALRGFDMFWILGADSIVHALQQMSRNPATNFLADQLTHKDWQGFAFYDLIFPLFVFIMGVSLVFSLSREREQHGNAGALKRIFRRFFLLYALGIFYYGGFANSFEQMRLVGVLPRIATAYLFAAILFTCFKARGLAIACVTLLLGYWALMANIPIRDIDLDKEPLAVLAAQHGTTNAHELYLRTTNYVSGVYDSGRNVANHFDFLYLPGRKHDGNYDPEGLLSSIPAVATALLGVLCGLLLRNPGIADAQKVRMLALGGVAAVALGWLWGIQFPVIKKIWTSSYALVAGGYSALLLALFYWLVEVRQLRRWTTPFVWIGTNAITVYLANNLLDFDRVANRLFGGEIKSALNGALPGLGELLIVAGGLSLGILFCGWLYRRKIFLRL